MLSISLAFGVVLKASAWSADNPESVKEYIIYVAGKEGVNVERALFFAREESRFNRYALRDSVNNPDNPRDDEYSCGIYQINTLAHSMTCEEAYNPFLNINWAIDHMAKGNWSMWYNVNQKWLNLNA